MKTFILAAPVMFISLALNDSHTCIWPHPLEGPDGLPQQLLAVDEDECTASEGASEGAEGHGLPGTWEGR